MRVTVASVIMVGTEILADMLLVGAGVGGGGGTNSRGDGGASGGGGGGGRAPLLYVIILSHGYYLQNDFCYSS